MRKVFLHLAAQFKHLGGKIVYATFSKVLTEAFLSPLDKNWFHFQVIISTNKLELGSAEQYMGYLLNETKYQTYSCNCHTFHS